MIRQKLTVLFVVISLITTSCQPQPAPDTAPVVLPIECIAQRPAFPTGCESVSTVMALQYLGETISTEEFIRDHLSMSDHFYYQRDELYGPDPSECFIGDPRTVNGYGCFAPVIERALSSYFGNNERVVNTTGTSIKELCHRYIDNGLPVILWSSIRMEPIKEGNRWRLEDGSAFVWPSGEHCVLLVGYSKNHYYVNDPYEGKLCAYKKHLVEARYREMNKQSIVITNKNPLR